jgi:uncharacterized membrane protein YdjX (TVP38/TMEM64 family)
MKRDSFEGTDRSALTKWWLALAALLVGAAVVAMSLSDILGFEDLHRHQYQHVLPQLIDTNPVLAPVIYVTGYAVLFAASVPMTGLLGIAGGYLFGWLAGAVYVFLAQFLGATATYLIARVALRRFVLARAGPRLRALRDGFNKHALSYLIAMHVSGLFPAVLVGGVPGALDVPLRTYVIATAVGLVPTTLLYANAGDGLGDLLLSGGAIRLADVFTAQIVVSLLGLAVLALVPVAYHRSRARKR